MRVTWEVSWDTWEVTWVIWEVTRVTWEVTWDTEFVRRVELDCSQALGALPFLWEQLNSARSRSRADRNSPPGVIHPV